jgi:long-subunit fatty acid transport protein
LSLGLATHTTEKFYYGVTLSIPFLRRTEKATIRENDMSGDSDNDFDAFTYTENITTRGTGILFRGGVLYKPFEQFRIGFNFQTPTFYTLTRTADAKLETSVENYARRINNDTTRAQQFISTTQDINNGNLYTYDYNLMTPWQMSLAVAYVFRETDDVKKQRAMITAAIDFINHQAVRFNTSNDGGIQFGSNFYNALNNDVKKIYRPAFNFSLGGELKFHTLMFRAGFRYQQSPFEKKALPEIKGYQLIPSLGIGYRDKGIFADLTYSHVTSDGIHFPYVLSSEKIYPFATSRINNGQILFTVGCKF